MVETNLILRDYGASLSSYFLQQIYAISIECQLFLEVKINLEREYNVLF